MKIKEIYPNLFLYTFPNQYEMGSTFVRLQEFYESPYKDIKGRYFTLENFMDLYVKDNDNKFTYFEDWNGFNIPGHIVDYFDLQFNFDFTTKEFKLFEELDDAFATDDVKDFYIIGVVEKDKEIIKHEVAHGLYYLNKNIKKKCLN